MKQIAKILIIFFLYGCGSGSSEDEASITPSQPKVVDIDPHEVGTLEKTIFHEGLLRNFILYVPESYDRNAATPMVFNFHGYGSNAQEQMYYSDIIGVADDEGFLVLHPQGTPHPLTGSSMFCVGGFTRPCDVDDVSFSNYLINVISTLYNLDMQRIYSTGMSNGGFMSFHLACNLSNRIAAIASVTGSMTPETYDECTPSRPIPIIQMHGLEDTVVPLVGIPNLMEPIDKVVDFWVEHNNCTAQYIVDYFDSVQWDNSIPLQVGWNGCDEGSEVRLYTFTGAGHTWPGNPYNTANTNYDIIASKEMWSFFKSHTINGSTE